MIKVQNYNSIPDHSIILKELNNNIHYLDSFKINIANKNGYSIDYLTALLFSSIPNWVRFLLNIRDFLVKPFGVETGIIPEQRKLDKSIRYDCGDKAVLFPVIDRSETEIVMSEDDKHLYFRNSLLIQNKLGRNNQDVYLTTIVQFHNYLGRMYFLIVMPFHKLIMKTMLKNLHKRLERS